MGEEASFPPGCYFPPQLGNEDAVSVAVREALLPPAAEAEDEEVVHEVGFFLLPIGLFLRPVNFRIHT